MNPISVWVSSNILKVKLIGLGAVLTALVAFHYYDRYEYSQKHTKAAVGALIASYEKDVKRQQEVAAKATDDLKKQHKESDKVKDEKLQDSNTKLANALNELRKRPTRGSTETSTNTTSITEACTGTQLFQEDAEFLTREAARADQVIIWRDYYYEQYEAARKKLDELAK